MTHNYLFKTPEIEAYCVAHSKNQEPILQQLEKATLDSDFYTAMLSGLVEGTFLRLITKLSGAKTALDIGMFTGYSAMAIASALPEDGIVYTCENDPKHIEFATKFINQASFGHKIKIKQGPALETIATLDEKFDLVFIDADKENYVNYYHAVFPKVNIGGIILVDNALRAGAVLNPNKPSDTVTDELNKLIHNDPRVENTLLTVRDGVHLVYKTQL